MTTETAADETGADTGAHQHGDISDKDRYRNRNRMKRVEGQARGITTMIDDAAIAKIQEDGDAINRLVRSWHHPMSSTQGASDRLAPDQDRALDVSGQACVARRRARGTGELGCFRSHLTT